MHRPRAPGLKPLESPFPPEKTGMPQPHAAVPRTQTSHPGFEDAFRMHPLWHGTHTPPSLNYLCLSGQPNGAFLLVPGK